MSDLATILDHIRSAPDHEPHWLALASHFEDNGNYDVAVVLRHHWPVLRDTLAEGVPLGKALMISNRDAARITRRAREAEERTVRRADGSIGVED